MSGIDNTHEHQHHPMPFRRVLGRACVGALSCALIISLFPVSSFAEDVATTTTTTPPAPITTARPELDTPLPDENNTPTTTSKADAQAQQKAIKANSKLDKATKALLDAQLAVDTTSEEIQKTRATLDELADKISKNEAILAIRKLPVEQLSKIIKKRAIRMYQDTGGAPTNAVDRFYYNRQTALAATAQDTNVTQLKSFTKQLKKVRKTKAVLTKQKKEADLKQAQLSQLSKDITVQLEAAKKEYEDTANQFLDANSVIGAKIAVDGKMCPIAGPMSHRDDWGNPRSGGRTHKGNDLFNAFGTPNVAIVGGRMEHNIDVLGGTGVKIFGDDGNVYYYAHLSAWAGDARRVEQGEVVGYTGDTGNALGGAPHTHFEIRLGGTQHINPYPIVRIICGV